MENHITGKLVYTIILPSAEKYRRRLIWKSEHGEQLYISNRFIMIDISNHNICRVASLYLNDVP